ncbi:VacB/RNase II family 3'-5' exoribonuclease [Leptospira wolffii]|uniref:ribonuclease R family protein n=1 Tax=Leptospira wolffii TaxID=409998 RepID=UPI00108256B4|nr:VacB/RNase II family 3'-5' exoribonuclease [Leptospira wolffii]TGK61893.1 VacB/RNase II family 3'-5' exoribonuclease [Leptospira wolffii]TGK68494.1 VacB/RNase II family 3'-5' exoribonuclease [Leptospira wolffii]TGK74723.1 VacB/RNase II family 3'-5' exoribonuclease [Leptospira wolffii]TGL31701.1 VacB/RNase II family 3'-5' exoribonuclease [Leptospira wolffii]
MKQKKKTAKPAKKKASIKKQKTLQENSNKSAPKPVAEKKTKKDHKKTGGSKGLDLRASLEKAKKTVKELKERLTRKESSSKQKASSVQTKLEEVPKSPKLEKKYESRKKESFSSYSEKPRFEKERSSGKKENHIPGYQKRFSNRNFSHQDRERDNEPGRKLLKFFRANAGKVVSEQEVYSRFLAQAGKKQGHRRERWEAQEQKRSALELLAFFEKEGLIEIQRKSLIIRPEQTLHGTIVLSRKGDGFAKLTTGTEVFIPAQYTSSAIQGDLVEILPTGIGRKGKLEGEVLSVLRRGRELYRMKVTEKANKFIIGTFLDMEAGEKEAFLPRKSLLQDLQDEINIGDVIVVTLDSEASHENNLYEAHFVRFESDTKEDVDLMRMLMKYNYNILYPEEVQLASLPDEVEESGVEDWGSRVDLRNLKSITIDGEYSKDFDDAISFQVEGKKIRFYVHIADVSHYVRPGTELDAEAYNRATSVYLGSRVVPMLPPELSENLCSLVAKKNRLAFTVEMEADREGNIFHAKFYKSVIRVDERYTYTRAEAEILEGNSENWIFQMMKFAETLRTKRLQSGRVDLNLKETKVVTDSNHTVVEIKTSERLNAHILIEEFMLSANIKVAEFIRKKERPTLYRVHEPMDEEKLEMLNSFLRLNGFNAQLADTSYESIRSVLQVVEGTPAERIFNISLLRSFMQAYYSGEQLGHWGLGFKDYCHFTSPIRRYPDLVCHRVLQSILLAEENPYNDEDVKVMGLHTSHEERKATDAERDYYKLKACRFLEKTGRKEFQATLTGFRSAFAFVELDNPPVEAVLPAIEFTDEGELQAETDFSFYSKKYTKQYSLGESFPVELDRIDFEEIRIYVKMKKFQKKG